jgi:hypothetical protein
MTISKVAQFFSRKDFSHPHPRGVAPKPVIAISRWSSGGYTATMYYKKSGATKIELEMYGIVINKMHFMASNKAESDGEFQALINMLGHMK